MSLSAYNSVTLNGQGGVPTVAASAGIGSGASIVAIATLIGAMAASVTCAAQMGVSPHVIAAGETAPIGHAYVDARPTLFQAARAELTIEADVSAYVLRTVGGSANFGTNAELLAIPAAAIGSADVNGYASIVANATRIQNARADALCAVTLSPAPTVVRMAGSNVNAWADLRVEAKRNNLLDGYADVSAGASLTLPSSGYAWRMASADVLAQTAINASPTKIQAARADLELTAEIDASPEFVQLADAAFPVSVQVLAQPIRYATAAASLNVGATMSAAPVQEHQGGAAASAGVLLVANPLRTATADASLSCNASMTATGLRLVLPEAACQVTGEVLAPAVVNLTTTGNFVLGTLSIQAAPTRYCLGEAAAIAQAGVTAVGVVVTPGSAAPAVVADVAAEAHAIRPGSAQVIGQANTLATPMQFHACTLDMDAGAKLLADAASWSVLCFGEASLYMAASFVAHATAIRPASAELSLSGQMTASGHAFEFWQKGFASCGAEAEFEVSGTVTRYASAEVSARVDLDAPGRIGDRFQGEANVLATLSFVPFAQTNPAAQDPPERTMFRAYVDRTMIRPFVNRTMTRTA